MMRNLKLDFVRAEGKLLVVLDAKTEKAVAYLTPEIAELWDNSLDGIIAWLEGVAACYGLMHDCDEDEDD